MKLEVQVACVNKDESLYERMNLESDVIFAVQSKEYKFKDLKNGDKRIRIISTFDRGVGKNRNKAIMNSFEDTDIILFSDEDLIYKSGYEKKIIDAFKLKPQADIIIFGLEVINIDGNKVIDKKNKRIKKLYIFNSLKYGTPRIAIRKNSLLKHNIWFSLLYGGGAKHCAGEDILFLVEAFKKNLKIYKCSEIIASTSQLNSSWFKGYNKKFFIDKGYWITNAFPKMNFFIIIYYTLILSKHTNKNFRAVLRYMLKGKHKFKKI